MFEVMGLHYCPTCPPEWIGKNKDRRGDPPLEVVTTNYSGTGVDIVRCPACGKRFQVSYKIDQITELEQP